MRVDPWAEGLGPGWTWVWYVCGIVLGAAMIAMFAFFEKKRSEVTNWLDVLKDWSA
jgi:hypothetical protein